MDHRSAMAGTFRAQQVLLEKLETENAKLQEAVEFAWVGIANVNGGDWTKQSEEWQTWAVKWRDDSLPLIWEKK